MTEALRPPNMISAYVEKHHGRRQGLARHLVAQSRRALGAFRDFETLDWSRVTRLVFVCTGNICRSAYGAAKAASVGIPSASFGLYARSRDPADAQAIASAQARGIDLRGHRARCADEVTLLPGDLLLAMEPWQAAELLSSTRAAGAQLSLLGLWSGQKRAHIEDPYGLGPAYFDTCLSLMDEAVAECRHRMGRTVTAC